MPAKIYLIRHGETDYNAVPRMQGWLDIPLNSKGHEQARKTAQSLANHHFDAIYSSDLMRAAETAAPLAKLHNLEITLTSHLRERDMGIFNGWAWEQENDKDKSNLWEEFEHARDTNDLDWSRHQGETLRQVSERLEKLFQHLHTHHSGEHVALVTHGGTINRIFEHFNIKKTVEGFRPIGNGAVHVLMKSENTYIMENHAN